MEKEDGKGKFLLLVLICCTIMLVRHKRSHRNQQWCESCVTTLRRGWGWWSGAEWGTTYCQRQHEEAKEIRFIFFIFSQAQGSWCFKAFLWESLINKILDGWHCFHPAMFLHLSFWYSNFMLVIFYFKKKRQRELLSRANSLKLN